MSAKVHRAPTGSTPLISRKDTIIIAMLVNIALLVVLFATASRRQESIKVEKDLQKQVATHHMVASQPAAQTISRKQPVDEIDEIVARFATNAPAEKVVVSTPKQVQETEEAEYYVVKSGDNPWTIARKFHIKFEDLLRLNNLDEAKAKNLKIGQKIRIR